MTMQRILLFGLLILTLLWGGRANAYCGDGSIESGNGEQCDDGNFTHRDGCDSYCKWEDITPPTLISTSIPSGAKGIPTNTNMITVIFSEAIDPLSITASTVSLQESGEPLEIELILGSDERTLTLHLKELLVSGASHALRIRSVSDKNGNSLSEESITVFEAAVHVDQTPPFVVADPPAGKYGFAQQISLIAYLGEEEQGPGFRDENVRLYFTVDDSYPTESSTLYTGPFIIEQDAKLRFFGIDGSGNKSQVFTQAYRFACEEQPNAKRMNAFPVCRILECERGFLLQNNTCVTKMGLESDYREKAFTAPLFSSFAPIVVSSKSAIHITSQHKGMIRRPIVFKNLKAGTEVHFEKDTKITDESGRAFEGYLVTPVTRFTKDFPVNFGTSFKAILEFTSPDSRRLQFNKPFQVVVPMGDRFDPEKEVSVLVLIPGTQEYQKFAVTDVRVDPGERMIRFSAVKTDIFFVSQPGENFTRAEFIDMENHWAKNYAEALYRKGIVKGRSKAVFAPDEPLTRAEFTKIALEAIGAPTDPTELVEDAPFPDVPLYAWYVGYIKKAKELELIHGYPDGSFKPEAPINRAEAVKILMGAFEFDLSAITDFQRQSLPPDVDPNAWYAPSINLVIKEGLLQGIRTPNGTILNDFAPGRAITRGEMAQLAIKAIELNETKKQETEIR